MLTITDLTSSKEMEIREMTEVRGGMNPFAVIDFSTGLTSKVADVDQAFAFQFAQGNVGAVTNNQAIAGGNGISYAPVTQTQGQYNDLTVGGIGNVSVS
jgi:hypothetical protein